MASAQSEAGDIEPGLKISAVPLNLQSKDRNSVARGSYLVNAVADSEDVIHFRNFCPEAIRSRAHLSRRSPKQFMTVMRSGGGKSANLLHVMPWPPYHNMNDQDVSAIYTVPQRCSAR
jgi:hypothetical protein